MMKQNTWPEHRPAPVRITPILCPECGESTGVLDTRSNEYGGITRHRACIAGHRFTTTEFFGDIKVLKKIKNLKPKLAEVMRMVDELLLTYDQKQGKVK